MDLYPGLLEQVLSHRQIISSETADRFELTLVKDVLLDGHFEERYGDPLIWLAYTATLTPFIRNVAAGDVFSLALVIRSWGSRYEYADAVGIQSTLRLSHLVTPRQVTKEPTSLARGEGKVRL